MHCSYPWLRLFPQSTQTWGFWLDIDADVGLGISSRATTGHPRPLPRSPPRASSGTPPCAAPPAPSRGRTVAGRPWTRLSLRPPHMKAPATYEGACRTQAPLPTPPFRSTLPDREAMDAVVSARSQGRAGRVLDM
jgi:hypothetical protein